MTDQDFDMVRRLLREHSAIVLDADKRYLVEGRLAPLIRQRNLNSLSELLAQLRTSSDNGLHRQIIEALVTSESSFFRDHHPFEALRKVVLPVLINRRSSQRRLDIWCAASAAGQEPYSVALLIREHFPELASWNIGLLATDLSREVLARAREGRYNQIEVNRGLPASLLVKYFEQRGTDWQLQSSIRNAVEFREMNLARPWPNLPRMDLVLIRNVMIYFDVETKKSILGRVARLLQPDGYLLLGGAETTINLHNSYRRVEPLKSGFYQLVG
jgi:chemotaxis protein methyltransferase CheR